MCRLEQIQLSLPPKFISVEKQLLLAVWVANDDEMQTVNRTPWTDSMAMTGLQSAFG